MGYIKYFTKKSKDEKIPIDKIINAKSDCLNKAKILDKDLKRLFKDYYNENYFFKKLLKIQKGRKEDKEIQNIKEINDNVKIDNENKELKKFTDKIDKSKSDIS